MHFSCVFWHKIDNTCVTNVSSIRDLGIAFDSKFTIESHINTIVKKACKTMGFLFRSLGNFKMKLMLTNYCTLHTNTHYRIHIDAIEEVQRRFTRALFRKLRFIPEKHYSTRNHRLNILCLEDRWYIIDELTLYKIHTGKLDTTLNNSLNFTSPIRSTRQSGNVFYLPFVKLNRFFNIIHLLLSKISMMFWVFKSSINRKLLCLDDI